MDIAKRLEQIKLLLKSSSNENISMIPHDFIYNNKIKSSYKFANKFINRKDDKVINKISDSDSDSNSNSDSESESESDLELKSYSSQLHSESNNGAIYSKLNHQNINNQNLKGFDEKINSETYQIPLNMFLSTKIE